MQRYSQSSQALASALLLGLASVASAHGLDEHMNMDMSAATMTRPTKIATSSAEASLTPNTYFHHDEYSGLMTAHIILMVLAWMFVLPVGVMLSISQSRYRIPVQFFFLATNAVGILLVIIYNASTPDLYPNNAHHKLGWFSMWIVAAQAFMGVLSAYASRGRKEINSHEERASFIPVSVQAMAEHERAHGPRFQQDPYRYSNDSGQGTEHNTESLRSQSVSSNGSLMMPEIQSPSSEEVEAVGRKVGVLLGRKLDRVLAKKMPGMISSKVLHALRFTYDAIDRTILLIGWTTFLTGWVTYGGFFMSDQVYSGLAHLIKGGVFFWFGIISLGRWAGCFADLGWAWNIKPTKANTVTAEFVESLLIFIYGCTNVFLEHLAAWGSEWSAQDLEHLSITFLFIGGGMCGLLIESKKIRECLSVTRQSNQVVEKECSDPTSYGFSLNPIPGLVTMLVGIMMSSHHQQSMVSTMIHKQWGTLLVAAAFARGATYTIYYIAPPASTLPGRPPSELITSFGLLAGGLIFMASARDTVMAMEANSIDAMFIFTVSVALVLSLMAWIIIVIAIKGWAVRKEHTSNKWDFPYRPVDMAT